MTDYDTTFLTDEEHEILHYGILRRSGRYPWGTQGHTPADRSKSFLDWFKDLLSNGFTEAEAAQAVQMTVNQIRQTKTLALAEKKAADIVFAQRLKDKGVSNVEIGKRLGVGESQVRNLLKPGANDKQLIISTVAQVLRENVASKEYVDVGKGVEVALDVSPEKLNTALAILQDEGYELHTFKSPQVGVGGGDQKTTYRVLVKEGVDQKEAWLNRSKIQQIADFSDDGGRTSYKIEAPLSLDSDRVEVNWAEDGGTAADGVMYVRPGVKDVSIGSNQYAQVRVLVDGDYYIKGMAVYKDDLPDGVDVLFNTNKSKADPKIAGDKLKALKAVDEDPDPNNPFGATIKRQIKERDPETGKEFVTSSMNILNEEGDWDDWSRTVSTQVLSKQSHHLAKQQLDIYHDRKQAEFDEIMELTNPVVKQTLLNSFADSADSAAVHMKAAGMPGQSTHVLMPLPKMKPTEVYAPNFENGDRVALVRYPHGGIFEIPELVVNNKNREAKKLLGSAKDAIGINPKVAEQLSGADFDGDTVLVIPNDRGQIRTAPVLKDLKGFDAKASYPGFDGMPVMSKKSTQSEMGQVSNLITDMTIMGAKNDEIARAVRHSMVVIDAAKHKLNYKQSEKDNGIRELRKKYSSGGTGGASTLISRASGPKYVPKFKDRLASEGGPIDPKTGKKVTVPTGEINKKTGKLKTRRVDALSIEDDAFRLVSTPGTTIEKVYATHSNRMKAMANTARKEMLKQQPIGYNPAAKKAYKKEVDSLNASYKQALRNKPLERQAQILANNKIRVKKQGDPELSQDKDKLRKVERQSLAEARVVTGATKSRMKITPPEWRAIQAGAISTTRLKEILTVSDLDEIKELATPKTKLLMNSAKRNRARTMINAGYTQAEVANALGVSLTTLKDDLNA